MMLAYRRSTAIKICLKSCISLTLKRFGNFTIAVTILRSELFDNRRITIREVADDVDISTFNGDPNLLKKLYQLKRFANFTIAVITLRSELFAEWRIRLSRFVQ